jgi:heptose-I-phosphate ethanolaminephosphotransferase
VYLSDHGENVYDYKNQLGHGCSNPVPKVNVEIPFIIWLSEAYKSNFKEKISHIESNKNLPYVTDDLFHGLIDLSGIKTNYLDTTRSIFNQGFNHKRKRILCDGNDYDLR